jgi:hypothetical protein
MTETTNVLDPKRVTALRVYPPLGLARVGNCTAKDAFADCPRRPERHTNSKGLSVKIRQLALNGIQANQFWHPLPCPV